MTQTDPTRLAVEVSGRNHAMGSPSAPITLVEYGDADTVAEASRESFSASDAPGWRDHD